MLQHDWKHVFDDLNIYSGWGAGLAEGRVPSADPMWQYPPLAAFVFGGVGLLGSQPWLFALLFVAVDIAISVLLARDGTRRGRWEGFAVWLAAPLLLGPIMYGRYDSVPTLAAMAGLLALSAPAAAGAILAVGGGLKVWPAVMAMAMSQRSWLRGALGAAVATGVVLVTAAWAYPSVISGFLGNGEARGLQTESVAALPFVWARLFVGEAGVPEAFRYGSSEVGLPLADAVAPWLIPLTGLGLLALVVARALGRLDHVPVADIAFVAILWLTITSRVLSPQYNVWLVGMAALVWAAWIAADAYRDDPRGRHRRRSPAAVPVRIHGHRRGCGLRGGHPHGADRGPARGDGPRGPRTAARGGIRHAVRERSLATRCPSGQQFRVAKPQHVSSCLNPPGGPMKRIRALAALSVSGLVLAACSTSDDTAAQDTAAASAASCDKASLQTIAADKLVIATGQPAYEPWVKNDAPESGEGFEAAVAYAAAEKLGYGKADVQWIRTTFDGAIAPGAKDFDWNLQQFSITEDREKAVDLSSPYYAVNQAIVSHTGSPIAGAKTLADLGSASSEPRSARPRWTPPSNWAPARRSRCSTTTRPPSAP